MVFLLLDVFGCRKRRRGSFENRGVTYEVSGVHESVAKDKATKSVVLELRTLLTENVRYFYLVYCDSLLGGCPDSWPKKFTAVRDGTLLAIVPLVVENEKAESKPLL